MLLTIARTGEGLSSGLWRCLAVPLCELGTSELTRLLFFSRVVLLQMANVIGQSLGYGKKDGTEVLGPTVGPTTAGEISGKTGVELDDALYEVGLPVAYRPFPVKEGPLADTIRTMGMQERALLVQASRCRVAMARLAMLQKIMAGRALQARESKEVERWKVSSVTMQKQLKHYLGTAGKEIAELLGEQSYGSANRIRDIDEMSAVTPDHHSEDDDAIASAKRRLSEIADGPTIRKSDGSLSSKSLDPDESADVQDKKMEDEVMLSDVAARLAKPQPQQQPQPGTGSYTPTTWSGAASVKQRPSISPPKSTGKAIFATDLEDKYRVATYEVREGGVGGSLHARRRGGCR